MSHMRRMVDALNIQLLPILHQYLNNKIISIFDYKITSIAKKKCIIFFNPKLQFWTEQMIFNLLTKFYFEKRFVFLFARVIRIEG